MLTDVEHFPGETPPNFDSVPTCTEEESDSRWIAEHLSCPDDELFTRGGCHIFAFALAEQHPNGCYELRRVVCETHHIDHIYIVVGHQMIDCKGIRSESDYLAPLLGHVIETLQRDELIADPPSKRFNQCCKPAFVQPALARARSLITSDPARFGLQPQ
jgi:hypothetical protein